MRTSMTLTVAAAGALLVGCQHPSPVPGGTGQYLDAPTGVVDALPEGVDGSVQSLAESCEGGDFSACGRLAYAFEHGTESSGYGGHGDDHGDDHGGHHGHDAGAPLEPNPAMAETLYRASCEAGWETSCVAVARMRMAAGGSVEMEEGQALMEGACERGMTEACFELANMYIDGTLPGSMRAAMPLLHDACAGGLGDACAELSARMR